MWYCRTTTTTATRCEADGPDRLATLVRTLRTTYAAAPPQSSFQLIVACFFRYRLAFLAIMKSSVGKSNMVVQ